MVEKGFQIHLIRTAQCMYQNTIIITRKARVNNNNTPINKGVRQGCPLLRILFNVYIDKVIKDWLQVIKQNILAKDLIQPVV
jgi:hypothetical protein